MADTVEDILKRAEGRARKAKLPYRGAVTPKEAHALIAAGQGRLIDVRTQFEWDYVGRVPETVLIEWKRIPSGELNREFLEELDQAAEKSENVLFMCRSGVRSHAAAQAAAQAGYASAFNVLEGFEGDLDDQQHRGSKGGWRKAGLPWIQS